MNIERTKRLEDLAGQYAERRTPLLLVGPPGCGKTVLTRRIAASIAVTDQHWMDGVRIRRCAGVLPITDLPAAPFRAPHHTISDLALFGRKADVRTAAPNYGEVTLAHGGLLFIDEAAEFRYATLERIVKVARDGHIVVGDTKGTTQYPAEFMLVAATNPCPCGYHGAGARARVCRCTPEQISRYARRVDCLRDFCEVVDLPSVLDEVTA